MVNHKQYKLFKLFVSAFLCWLILFSGKCLAARSWDSIDAQIENKIFQLNIGLKMKLRKTLWVQTAGLSAKKNYYVFTTSSNDKGYQVVGRGSSFQALAVNKQKMFVVTSNHVLENVNQIEDECEMFYAALALYAERSGVKNNQTFAQLLSILNLFGKKDSTEAEKELCQKTADAIWDCYDRFLSKQADPHRLLFNRYNKQVPIDIQVSCFLHVPGPLAQTAVEAQVYRRAKARQPDLAILIAAVPGGSRNKEGLSLERKTVIKGTEIQIVGYPASLDQKVSNKCGLRPTYNNGTVTKTTPQMLEFTAAIAKGNSGGPVINRSGNVVGIVTTRGMTDDGHLLSSCGTAVSVEGLRNFAPELFK